MSRGKEILVTGGAGFIGAHLVRQLIDAGHRVTVWDNFSRGLSENLEGFPKDRVTIEGLDLIDEKAWQRSLKPFDVLYHLAAINGTEYFYTRPAEVLDVNIRMLLHAVRAAADQKTGRFVFFSSSEVYQLPSRIPTPEEVPFSVPEVRNPRYTYALSKMVGEAYCHHFLKSRGIPFTIIRPHNFYGPRMGFKHVIPEIAVKCLSAPASSHLPIQGTGEETRAFCFIRDAVKGIAAAGLSEKAVNETIHLGNDHEEIRIRDLAMLIMKKLGRDDLSLEASPLREGSVVRRCPDIGRARLLLGFEPETPLSQGLEETLAWVKAEWEKGGHIEKRSA